MVDKKDTGNIKAIRQGIVIKTEEDKPEAKEPNQYVVDTLKRLTAEAEKGYVQELAYSVCGDLNEYDIVGFTSDISKTGYHLRGLTLIYEDVAYAHMFDDIFMIDDFED